MWQQHYNCDEIGFYSSWLLANKLTIFFSCLTTSHFDIVRDVSTATASPLQAIGLTGLVQHYVSRWLVVMLCYFVLKVALECGELKKAES